MARTLTKPSRPAAPPAPTDRDLAPAGERGALPWWKLVVVYPTLAVSVLSSVPTYVELLDSSRLGVPFGQSSQAVRENRLWQENADCAAAPFDGQSNQHNVRVDAVVCPSGHVLVRVKPPGASTAYKWVPLDSVVSRTSPAALFDVLISRAHAQPAAPRASGNFEVKCQRWLGSGRIQRRILDRASNKCFDEVVDTYTGKVVQSTPASSCSC